MDKDNTKCGKCKKYVKNRNSLVCLVCDDNKNITGCIIL